jgi:hypothetical protein
MRTAFAFIATMMIATSPVLAVTRNKLEAWTRACDQFRRNEDKCDSRSCMSGLSKLMKPYARTMYLALGVGTVEDYEQYEILLDYCERRSVLYRRPPQYDRM